MKINLTILFLIAVLADGAYGRIADLDKVGFEAAKFICNRDTALTPLRACAEYTGRVAFVINVRILDVFYWENKVHTEAVSATVKTVGWHFELGANLFSGVQLYHEHHSRHIMDEDNPYSWDARNSRIVQDKFPVEDSVGIRFIFYTNPNPQKSMFKVAD